MGQPRTTVEIVASTVGWMTVSIAVWAVVIALLSVTGMSLLQTIR